MSNHLDWIRKNLRRVRAEQVFRDTTVCMLSLPWEGHPDPFIPDEDGHVHRHGTPWTEALKPRRLHRHRVWSACAIDDTTAMHRCACGAIRKTPRSKWRKVKRP